MGFVAIQAVVRSWIMFPLGFHLPLYFVVTSEAQVRTLCQQKRLERRLVRIVTTRALASRYRLMPAHRLGQTFFDVIVTFPADRTLIRSEHTWIRTCMRGMAGEALAVLEWVMDEGAGIFLHQHVVAFRTQVRFDRLEKRSLVRTVAVVTRYAVTPPYRSMHVRLEEFVLHFRMAGVADRIGPVDEDVGGIRTMRIVAIGALMLFIGRMQLCELPALLFYLRMTRKTQIAIDGVQKRLMRCRMRTMAGEATVFTLEGLMLVRHPRARIFMAREAELVAGLQEQSRILGGVWVVTVEARTVFEWFVLNRAALGQIFRIVAVAAKLSVFRRCFEGVVVRWSVVARLAFGADDRVMGAFSEKFRLRRGMGIMADGAGFFFDGVFAVRFFEESVAAVVAGKTEFRWSHREQISFRRRVGQMAFRAPLCLHDLMRKLVSEILLFMAFEADRIAFSGQKVW